MPLLIEPEGGRDRTALRVSFPKTLEADLRLYQRALGGEEKASLNHIIVSAVQKFLARDKEFQTYRSSASDREQAARA